MKKIVSLLLITVMLFSVFVCLPVTTATAATFIPRLTQPDYSNAYYKHVSYGGLNECIHISGGSVMPNCVGYAWGRAYEILGTRPNLSRTNADTWYNNNINSGAYSYGKTPKLGAIMCWASGNGGHVAVVEKIEGNTITISESAYGGFYFRTKTGTQSYIESLNSNFQGYIYIGNFVENLYVDLGTDFYAYIINTSSWKHLTNIGGNVVISTETGKASQVWKFDLQSNGSYKITNCADGLILEDVNFGTTNGSNVAVFGNNDSSAQRWFISGESASYQFRAQCGDLVLNVDNGSSADGTNVNMWAKNDSAAQKFQVWKLNKPGSTYVQCAAGSTYKPTVIQWNATSDTKSYDVKIWNGTYWQGEPYKTVWGVTGTSCEVDLPPGYYEAYVDSRNNFSATMSSNIIKFTVVDSAEPVNIGDNVYGALLVNEPWVNVTNVDNNAELQDDDVYSKHHVVWNFQHQSDGSYVIRSCADSKVLTVDTSNNNVFLKEYENIDSQKWYIYGRWSGEYSFKPKSSNYVLSVEEDSFELGNNICVSKLNYTSDQKYAIYEVDPSILEATTPTQDPTVAPTQPQIKIGDTDEDGIVNIFDATEIQLYLAKYKDLSDTQMIAADADKDGIVNIFDVTRIQLYLAKYITEL